MGVSEGMGAGVVGLASGVGVGGGLVGARAVAVEVGVLVGLETVVAVGGVVDKATGEWVSVGAVTRQANAR